jgi:hypothetical protein
LGVQGETGDENDNGKEHDATAHAITFLADGQTERSGRACEGESITLRFDGAMPSCS